jgi:hypothetical protein
MDDFNPPFTSTPRCPECNGTGGWHEEGGAFEFCECEVGRSRFARNNPDLCPACVGPWSAPHTCESERKAA